MKKSDGPNRNTDQNVKRRVCGCCRDGVECTAIRAGRVEGPVLKGCIEPGGDIIRAER